MKYQKPRLLAIKQNGRGFESGDDNETGRDGDHKTIKLLRLPLDVRSACCILSPSLASPAIAYSFRRARQVSRRFQFCFSVRRPMAVGRVLVFMASENILMRMRGFEPRNR